jgi:NADPH-dependent curcumin reductase CurA
MTAPPEAFIGMLWGKDFGRLVMKAAEVDHQHSAAR